MRLFSFMRRKKAHKTRTTLLFKRHKKHKKDKKTTKKRIFFKKKSTPKWEKPMTPLPPPYKAPPRPGPAAFYKHKVDSSFTKGISWAQMGKLLEHVELRHGPATPEGEQLRIDLGMSKRVYEILYNDKRKGLFLKMLISYIAMKMSTENITIDTHIWWKNFIQPKMEAMKFMLVLSRAEARTLNEQTGPLGRILSDTERELDEAIAEIKTLKTSNSRLEKLLRRENHHNQLLIKNEAVVLKEVEMVKSGTRPGSMAMLGSFQTLRLRLDQVEKAIIAFASFDDDLDPLRVSLAKITQSLSDAMRENIKKTMLLNNALVTNSELRTWGEKLFKQVQELKVYSKKAEHFETIRHARNRFEFLYHKQVAENLRLERKYHGVLESAKSYKEFTEQHQEFNIQNATKPLKKMIRQGTKELEELKASLTKTKEDATSDQQSLNSDIQTISAEKEALENRIGELQLSLQSAAEARDRLEEDMANCDARVAEVNQSNGRLKEEKNMLRTENEELENERKEHRSEVECLRAECDRLKDIQTQSIQFRDENEVLKSMNDQLLIESDECKARIKRTQEQNDQLKNDMSALDDANGRLSDKVKLGEEETAQLMKEVMELQASNKDLRESMAQSQVLAAEQSANTIEDLQGKLQASSEGQMDIQNLKNENEETFKQNRHYEQTIIHTMRLQGEGTAYKSESSNLGSFESTLVTAQDGGSFVNVTSETCGKRDGPSPSEAGDDLPREGVTSERNQAVKELLTQNKDLKSELAKRTAEFENALASRDTLHRTEMSVLYEIIRKLEAKAVLLDDGLLYIGTALATEQSEVASSSNTSEHDASQFQVALAPKPVVGRDMLLAQIAGLKAKVEELEFGLQNSDAEKQACLAKMAKCEGKFEAEKRAWFREDYAGSRLEAVRDTLRQRIREAADLERTLHRMRHTNGDLRDQIAVLKEELDVKNNVDEVEELKATVSFYQTQQKSSDKSLKKFQLDLAEARSIIAQRDADSASFTRMNRELTISNAELKLHVLDLKRTNNYWQTEQESSDKKLGELQDELGITRAIISERNAGILSITRTKEDLAARNSELVTKVVEIEKRMASIKSECAAAQELAQKSMQDAEKMKKELAQAEKEVAHAKKEAGRVWSQAQAWNSENVVVKEQNKRMSAIINSGGAGPISDGIQSPVMRSDILHRQLSGRYHAHQESVSSAFNGLPPSSPCLPYARMPYAAISSPKNSSPPPDLRGSMQQVRRGGHLGTSMSRVTGQRFPVTPHHPHFPRSPLPPAIADNQRSSSMPNPSTGRSVTLQPRVPVKDAFEKKEVVNQSVLQASLAKLAANMAVLPLKFSSPQGEPAERPSVWSAAIEATSKVAAMPVMSARQQEKAPGTTPPQPSQAEAYALAQSVLEGSLTRQKIPYEKNNSTGVASHAPSLPVKSIPEQKAAPETTAKQSSNAELVQKINADRRAKTKQADGKKAINKPERIIVKSGTVANLREKIRSDSSLPGVLRTSASLINLQDNPFIKRDTEAVSRASTPELAGDKDKKTSGESTGKADAKKASQTLVQSRAQQFLSSAQVTQKRSVSDPELSTSPTRGRAVSEEVGKPKLNVRTSFLSRLEGLVGGAAEAQRAASNTEPPKTSLGLNDTHATSPGVNTGDLPPLINKKIRDGPGARYTPALNVNTQRLASFNTAPTRPSPLANSFKFDSVAKFPDPEPKPAFAESERSVAGSSKGGNLVAGGARTEPTPFDSTIPNTTTTNHITPTLKSTTSRLSRKASNISFQQPSRSAPDNTKQRRLKSADLSRSASGASSRQCSISIPESTSHQQMTSSLPKKPSAIGIPNTFRAAPENIQSAILDIPSPTLSRPGSCASSRQASIPLQDVTSTHANKASTPSSTNTSPSVSETTPTGQRRGLNTSGISRQPRATPVQSSFPREPAPASATRQYSAPEPGNKNSKENSHSSLPELNLF